MFSKVLCCVCVCSVVSNSLQHRERQPARLLCPWNVPGEKAGVGCHVLLQGLFSTQGLNLHLLHWQAVSLPLVPPGKTFFKGGGIQISRPGLIRVSLGWETLLYAAVSTASKSAANSSWRPGTMQCQSVWEQGIFLVSFPFLNFFC